MTDRIKNPNWIGDEEEDFDLKYIRENKPLDPIIIDLKLKIALNKDRMMIIDEKKKDKHKYLEEYKFLENENKLYADKIMLKETSIKNKDVIDQNLQQGHDCRFFGC